MNDMFTWRRRGAEGIRFADAGDGRASGASRSVLLQKRGPQNTLGTGSGLGMPEMFDAGTHTATGRPGSDHSTYYIG